MSHRRVRDAVGFVSGLGSVVKVLSRQPFNPSLLLPLSGGVVRHPGMGKHINDSVITEESESATHREVETNIDTKKEVCTQPGVRVQGDSPVAPIVTAGIISNVPIYDNSNTHTSEAYFNKLTEAHVAEVQAQAHIVDDDVWFNSGMDLTGSVPKTHAIHSIEHSPSSEKKTKPTITDIDTDRQRHSHEPRRKEIKTSDTADAGASVRAPGLTDKSKYIDSGIADRIEDVVVNSGKNHLENGVVVESIHEQESRTSHTGRTSGKSVDSVQGKVDDNDGALKSASITQTSEGTATDVNADLENLLNNSDGPTESLEEVLSTHEGLGASAQARKVPVSAASRLFGYAGLFTRIGTNMLTDRVKESIGIGSATPVPGQRKSRVMTEKNADAMVNTLCRMRGAALKLGQVLSIQDNTMVAPEIQAIFNRVRLSADFMPADQMMNVMTNELGDNWRKKFNDFAEKPMAAASIGQVHRAHSLDGRKLAVKIQYPGIADSIDSDFGLLLRLLKMTNALPEGAFLEKSITCSRDELVEECQYIKEAEHMDNFRALLQKDDFYHIPLVDHELSTNRVLTMEYVDGVPLEQTHEYSQDVRDKIAYNVMRLCLKELFEWRYMQTDPNWANFLYDPKKGKLNLLDFGAARRYEAKFIDEYLRVIKAAADRNKQGIADASHKLGYLTGFEADLMVDAHCSAVLILGEPFAAKGKFDFHGQDVTRRINELIPIMLKHRLTPPPQETYSLHRKLSGAFLICARLRANIDVSTLFNDLYEKYEFNTVR